ncbi:MAG: hypothetical protein DSM106950_20250 [Stigonema ocellatum SAG 48.90 = DSM 106950]|nr:hypothetical protein [Stigonema ocellatum SAG 48.90 = DSM 106950]
MGSGEWGVGSGEWGMGNGEWGMGMGIRDWGLGSPTRDKGQWRLEIFYSLLPTSHFPLPTFYNDSMCC